MMRQPEGSTARAVLEDAIRCVIERVEAAGVEHDWSHSFVDVWSPQE